jgi:hypothetical protein
MVEPMDIDENKKELSMGFGQKAHTPTGQGGSVEEGFGEFIEMEDLTTENDQEFMYK